MLEDGRADGDFAALALASAADQIWIFIPQGFLTKEYLTDKLKNLVKKGVKLSTFQIKNQYGYLESDETERFFTRLDRKSTRLNSSHW